MNSYLLAAFHPLNPLNSIVPTLSSCCTADKLSDLCSLFIVQSQFLHLFDSVLHLFDKYWHLCVVVARSLFLNLLCLCFSCHYYSAGLKNNLSTRCFKFNSLFSRLKVYPKADSSVFQYLVSGCGVVMLGSLSGLFSSTSTVMVCWSSSCTRTSSWVLVGKINTAGEIKVFCKSQTESRVSGRKNRPARKHADLELSPLHAHHAPETSAAVKTPRHFHRKGEEMAAEPARLTFRRGWETGCAS